MGNILGSTKNSSEANNKIINGSKFITYYNPKNNYISYKSKTRINHVNIVNALLQGCEEIEPHETTSRLSNGKTYKDFAVGLEGIAKEFDLTIIIVLRTILDGDDIDTRDALGKSLSGDNDKKNVTNFLPNRTNFSCIVNKHQTKMKVDVYLCNDYVFIFE